MAFRAAPLARSLSTSSPKVRSAVPGVVNTSAYTATGGTGHDATALSSSLEEASRKAVAVYRASLRSIPDMRRNFTIMEDASFLTAVIRDSFERHRGITDPKIVDMLVFKAVQELREIREQWKSRTHLNSYIHRYTDKLLRQELVHKASTLDSSDSRDQMLHQWRDRGLVPHEIASWPMFTRWSDEQDLKFRNFAVDNKLFSDQQLERNANSSSSCIIM